MSEYYQDRHVAEAYDRDLGRHSDTVDDIPFYVDLAKQTHARGERVLELGCGTGRITIPIAQAGVDVTGLDSSAAMLEIARRKAGTVENPRWVEADMRDFELVDRFGLVIIPFRSFLHLLTETDQIACLERVRNHLLPDGRFALNFFNPDLRLLELAKRDVDPRSFISRVERRMRLRHVTRDEMERLLARAGFEVEALYGWFDKRPFTAESSEMVCVTKRL